MNTHEDLNDHPFAVFQASESYESPAEKAWLRWVTTVEKLVGHSIDGDQAADGYSFDDAYEAWEAGVTPKDYATKIKA